MSLHPLVYADRREAGAALAAELKRYHGRGDVVVLALPRGGVPVAYEVAHALEAPLDVFVVRKLGLPGHRELALGAIASGGVRVLNQDVIGWYGVGRAEIEAAARIVVAAPVGAPHSCSELQELADEVVCAQAPRDFAAVGQFYADFEQTGDAEVCELLHEAAAAGAH